MPLLPALAILGAIGWSVVTLRLRRVPPARLAALRAVVAAALVLPGLILYGGWMSAARPAVANLNGALLGPNALKLTQAQSALAQAHIAPDDAEWADLDARSYTFCQEVQMFLTDLSGVWPRTATTRPPRRWSGKS